MSAWGVGFDDLNHGRWLVISRNQYLPWVVGDNPRMARSSQSLPKGKGHYKLKAKRKAQRRARRLNR